MLLSHFGQQRTENRLSKSLPAIVFAMAILSLLDSKNPLRSNSSHMPKLIPRSLGLEPLSPVTRRASTEAEKVQAAETHLIQLLHDPYYYEAYQRIKKRYRAHLNAVRNLGPRGELAARYQWAGDEQGEHRARRGRPRSFRYTHDFLLVLFKALQRHGHCKSIARFSKLFVARTYPSMSRYERAGLERRVSQTVYYAQRRSLKNQGALSG